MSYARLSQLKSRLGIDSADTTRDASLQQLLDGVSAYIDNYTKRTFSTDAVTVTDELYDRPQGNRLFLKNVGIKSVVAVKLGQDINNLVTLDSTAYSWNPNGRLVFGGFQTGWFDNGDYWSSDTPLYPELSTGLDSIRVSYTFGGGTVPADIVNACLDLAAESFRNDGIDQERIGDWQIRYDKRTAADGPLKDMLGVLDAYRLRSV